MSEESEFTQNVCATQTEFYIIQYLTFLIFCVRQPDTYA